MKTIKLLAWSLALLGSVSFADNFRLEGEKINITPKCKIGVGREFSEGKYVILMEKKSSISGDFKLAKSGKYYVWARTMTYGEKWRTGELSINGQKIGTFGDAVLKDSMKKGSWYWARLEKPIELTAGKISVSVSSPLGMVRLDTLILTDDPAFKPSDDRAELEKVQALPPFSDAPVAENLPVPNGKGENVLLFHGGRPWVAGETSGFLVKSGCRVTALSSVYLNGFGGASIKAFLTDLVEPEAKDGITPAMARLKDYKLVMIASLPTEMQQKIFTPERIARLKEYVRNGGTLMVNFFVPENFGDLLPVRLGPMQPNLDGLKVKRPADKIFRVLPAEWQLLGTYRKAELQSGAEMLAPITDDAGKTVGIFASVKNYGKGKVLFYNEEWARKQGMRQIFSWAYGPALISALAGYVSGIDLHPEATLYPLPAVPARKTHGKLTITVMQPQMQLNESGEKAELSKKNGITEIRFANGIRLEAAGGVVNVFWKDAEIPYLREFRVPELVFSGKLADVDANTAEVKVNASSGKSLSGKWNFEGARLAENGKAVLTYLSENGTKLEWSFKAGTLQLEGREFAAFAEQVTILSSPNWIESLKYNSRYATAENTVGHWTRRMSAYSPPRGYAEFDLSGAKKADTWSWAFFGSGQPFTWIVSPAGIYSEFVDFPVPASPRLQIQPGEKSIQQELTLIAGYRRAPLSLPYVWHAFSPGAERGNNDWMAMYQFQRKFLRGKTGMKDFAVPPTVTWQNVCSPEDIEAALKSAAELGFRRVALPWCPSAIEDIDSEAHRAAYRQVRSYGLMPFPWSAGDYCHGDSEKIFRDHKDWFVRKLDGSMFCYMGNYPVLDLNNPDFRKWYFGKMSNAIREGIGAIYFDMYGAAIGNINYGKPGSEPGMAGALRIMRFFSDRNVMIGVEGQNPLVTDNYWFRQRLYNSFQGKEFAMLMASPSTGNTGDDMALDYFRTSMHGAFTYINVDGYAKKFERTPGEIQKIERMGRLNPLINKAQANVGYPFIRETPFGTLWISEKGGALFFYDAVEELKVELPDGWSIEGVPGNVLKNVKPDSICCLKNHK